MTRVQMNRLTAFLPFVFSVAALAIVLPNIIARVPPQPDETASAHIFQLLIVAQLPLMALFAATANWHRARRVALLLALQLFAIIVALTPVWLAGY